jgi:hypothetical protein
MTLKPWRSAYASVIGTSHVKSGTPCQDAGGCVVVTLDDEQEVLIAAVSDGAGTASHSDVGSSLVVDRFLRDFSSQIAAGVDFSVVGEAFARKWLASVCDELSAIAEAEGHDIRKYSCTLLGAIVTQNCGVYMQIGDGAIVVSTEESGEYSWIFWPQHGEYANSTNFLTQENANEVLQFEIGPSVQEIALFSDGIERLVLNLAARTVHSPAFRSIFDWLAGTEPDRANDQSPALIAYLSSAQVNNRTDDDKTLVMATRVDPGRLAG